MRFRSYLLDERLLTDELDERLQQECTAEVDEAVHEAEAALSPEASDLLRDVWAEGGL